MGMRLNLGNLAADAGEPEAARELLEASREMAEQQRQFRCAGWATLPLAELAIADGDAERAAGLLDAALGQSAAARRPVGHRALLELDQAAAKGSLSRSRQG